MFIVSFNIISILAVIIFVGMVIFGPEKLFYTKYFALWRRVHVKWRGRFDYFWYTLKSSLRTSPIMTIPLKLWYLYKRILYLFPLIPLMIKYKDNFFSEILAVAIFFFCADIYRNNRTEKLNAQYAEVKNNPAAYDNITTDDGSFILDFKSAGSVCINPSVNEWLLAAENIGLQRSKEYEKGLRLQISDESNWENIYSLFLHNNYAKSAHFGYQFINESKFGISGTLDQDKDYVEIHKTCYFDSYLTNIIPGKSLTRSADGRIVSGTEKFMPYGRDRVLMSCGDDVLRNIYRANQPGISTLLILPDGYIIFWRQNQFVLSESGKIAPSGSGSADWDDCKHFLSDPDGFRKSIAHAMERELWEESFSSEGKISEEDFMNNTETRIIGHFRWLQKSGKYEFVGITRFLQKLPGCNAPKPCSMEVVTSNLCPKISAVKDALRAFPVSSSVSGNENIPQDTLPSFMGTKITSKTRKCRDKRRPDVKITKETITTEEVEIKNISDAVKFSENSRDSFIEIKDYSVPCAMAVLYLRQLCSDYCEKCPAKTEYLSGKIKCDVKLEEVIFTR